MRPPRGLEVTFIPSIRQLTSVAAEDSQRRRRFSPPCPGDFWTVGAGAGIRTRTPLRARDFKTEKKGQQFNALLSCCLFSLRGLRIATVFYEGYGHPGGHLSGPH